MDPADLPEEPPVREPSTGISINGCSVSDFLPPQKHPTKAELDAPIDIAQAIGEGLAQLVPGPMRLAHLAQTDFETLDELGRIEALVECGRIEAWIASHKQKLLATVITQDSTDALWCVEEVAAAMRLSGQRARNELHIAQRLCTSLPGTLAALSAGQIDIRQATVITERSTDLPDEVLGRYEARVLKVAPRQSIDGTRRTAKQAALSLDPAGAKERAARQVADRHVTVRAGDDDDMAWLQAYLPAADAQAMFDALTAVAKTASAEDVRTRDQRRADVLVDLVLNGAGEELPTSHGRRPNVDVVISLATLIGQDDEPGWLDGYGPITADYARQIAHDPTGTWRRLITDPVDGRLLDYGTTVYEPPAHLAAHVIARDGTCTFPFCDARARHCDLDHIVPFPEGPTSADNLDPKHRRHHNAKTHHRWRTRRDPVTGDTHWRSPLGRHYITSPPQRWTLPPAATPITEPEELDTPSDAAQNTTAPPPEPDPPPF